MQRATIIGGLLVVLAALAAPGADAEEQRTIAFHLPGQFKVALAKAKATRRPMLFKGVGQIVDDLACRDTNRGQC